jgi:hypothetical protein
MFRSTLLAVVLPLALAGTARAMPGDPPVVPLAPADGAEVPANADGIGVGFQCPDYRIAVFGSVTQYGDYGDYGVRFSDRPDLGSDGRLATNPYGSDAGASLAPDRTCTAKLDTFDTASSPEIAGGRVYWQAYRYCNGCTPQYETGGVRSFVVRPSASGRLRAPKRVYAGYPAVFTVESAAKLSGADVVLQRRAGRRWRTVARRPFLLDGTELVAVLPAGRQKLRALAVTGATRFQLAGRTVAVRRPGARRTTARDDGRYGGSSTFAFTVSGGGKLLRSFNASVSVFCVGPTQADNRVQIAFARLRSVRIAPDGSVTGYLRTKGASPASVTLTGRLHNRRFKGRVSIAFSTCAGERKLTAARRAG